MIGTHNSTQRFSMTAQLTGFLKGWRKPFFLVGFILTLSACAAQQHSEPVLKTAAEPPTPMGYSGMAQMDSAAYLVVHDAKPDEGGPWLGVIRIDQSAAPRYEPLAVGDWKHPDGQANDLESACAIPERAGEFLVAESGYRKGRYGRIFHLSAQGANAQILKVFKLPLPIDDGGEAQSNFEGMACATRSDGKVLVILGERGGSKHHPTGELRWGWFDPQSGEVNWQLAGKAIKRVTAPGGWADPKQKRDIADLYLDANGALWAVASKDAGDDGPFRSIIYKAATIKPNSQKPIKINKEQQAAWIVDGLKVEALAGPPGAIADAFLSFATEDENLGGIWRPLYAPLKSR